MIPAMNTQDSHTHFFGRSFFNTLAKVSPRPEDADTLLAEVSQRAGLELPDPDPKAHADRWLAQMDAAHIDRMVTFASLPPEAPAVAEAAQHAAGRLLPYTVIDPTADNALQFAEKAFGSMGFRGLLLFPAMHHFDVGAPEMSPFYDLAQAHNAPVVVHCGILQVKLRDLVGLPRPYDLSFANPLSVIPAANRFPKLTFIIPHFGGGFFREALMAGLQCENVMLDSSSSNSWMLSDPGMLSLSRVFRKSIDALGAERILYGSDSCTFPRGYRVDIRDVQLEALRTAGATDAQISRIFSENMAALLP
ncbi:MAG: putative TIM-barrel fold metal-dependent hydrolase [Pseudohongiellaceae bacterium]|jgi:predicted TIM-barrel fold metal-dependent hydrolase